MSERTVAEAETTRTAVFPRQFRLLKTGEFSSVFNFRKAIKSQHFLLHYRRHLPDESSGPRLGLVIGKRLLSRSVYRNLVKRLAREAFRQIRGQLPAVDIVMRLAAKPGRPDRKLIAAEMQELLQKLANKRNPMKVAGAEQAPKAAAS